MNPNDIIALMLESPYFWVSMFTAASCAFSVGLWVGYLWSLAALHR